ncbi:MAG: hypothetical protein KGI71_06660 [Patescibacteria group bacterium]|nr:hypothetical protein [Patescibacteria group bacterium]
MPSYFTPTPPVPNAPARSWRVSERSFDVYLEDRGEYVAARFPETGVLFTLPWPFLARYARSWVEQGFSLSN